MCETVHLNTKPDNIPAPKLAGKNEARPTILNFVPQMLEVT